jgi:D-3-phosphoglycerate dehydrogenase
MQRCKLIQMPSAGFDVIDHQSAAEFGIPVANTAGHNKESVADWTVMAAIALVRKSFWADRAIRAGGWHRGDRIREEVIGRELSALTVGIVGLGHVGTAVGRRLASFGCRVVFADIVPKEVAGGEQVELDTLLSQSDIVCLHLPLDSHTRGLIGKNAFSRMKAGSFLINAARGPVVDEVAMTDALGSGVLSGAALDVFEAEPLPLASPLRVLENVILSPHAGGATVEARARLTEAVSSNLLRVLDGLPPQNVVNGVG